MSLPRFRRALLTLGFACAPRIAGAEVRLPHVLSDHMVLQRDAPMHVWGWAEPGETVRVALDGDTEQATTNALGQWSVFLKRHAAGGPYTLQVRGNGAAIVLQDVMIGDLWIASGQSNMEMPLAGWPNAAMKDSAQEIAAANHPELRLLTAPRVGADFPREDVDASWSRCTPETAKQFSAAAYFFGREIAAKEHVTVGLVDTTWGGTPAEAWTSFDAFGKDPALTPVWAQWSRFTGEQTTLAATVAAEKREDEQRKQAGQAPLPHPWHPQPESYKPAGLYNGMIAPFTPLSIRGVIWYQGETNSRLDRSVIYHRLFQDMIVDWRAHFAQGQFPFLFAQISSFRSTPQEAWGVVRDAQRRTLELANTGMVVTLDVGTPDNVHPPDKQTVGHRFALAARALAYGEAVPYTGPLFARADVEGDGMRVGFEGRTLKLDCRGGACKGFEIAGEDHNFFPAEASVAGAGVVVRSGSVPHPRYVRYAWANATDANLEDSAGLPASTFTSEQEIDEPGPRGKVATQDF